MIMKMLLDLKTPAGQWIESFCDRFPLLSMLLLQLVFGAGLIACVSLIALAGGSVIWIFYRLAGVM